MILAGDAAVSVRGVLTVSEVQVSVRPILGRICILHAPPCASLQKSVIELSDDTVHTVPPMAPPVITLWEAVIVDDGDPVMPTTRA